MALPLAAQTTVAQIIDGPNGLPATGQATIKLSEPCSWEANYVGTTAIKVPFTAGAFTVELVPNDACITVDGQLNTTYAVDFLLIGGTRWPETWTVPTGAPRTVNQVNGTHLANGTLCFQVLSGVVTPTTCGSGGGLSLATLTNGQLTGMSNPTLLSMTN
jgi:hypothetical protein